MKPKVLIACEAIRQIPTRFCQSLISVDPHISAFLSPVHKVQMTARAPGDLTWIEMNRVGSWVAAES